jgi:hypothetical protein
MAFVSSTDPAPASAPPAPIRAPASRYALALRIASILGRIFVIVVAVLLAAMIAHTSKLYAHPDEDMHIEAFQWFESHWTPPELGSSEVRYSPMGWSRVFTGEIVYPVYGKLGSLLLPHYDAITNAIYPPFETITHWLFIHLRSAGPAGEDQNPRSETEGLPPEPLHLYRNFNVCLLAVTLAALLFTRCRWCNLRHLALVLLCIPQVIYIYAYANSDAWGLTWSVLLFVQTANLMDHPPITWRWYRVAMWMFSALMLLLSKTDFLLGLVLPVVLLIVHFVRYRRTSPSLLWYATRLAAPLVIVVILAGLWNPALSIHRSEWAARVAEMREEMSHDGRRPSDPYIWNYYMASKGVTYLEMLHARDNVWMRRTLQSYYGQFGGWSVAHSQDIYNRAWQLGVLALLLTLIAQFVFRRRMNAYLLTGLLLAPVIIAINVYGMLYYSLHIDFQPQGRYLFPSLVAVFFLTAGTMRIENKYYRWLHLLVFVPLLVMSIYTLLYYGAWEPELQNSTYWSHA